MLYSRADTHLNTSGQSPDESLTALVRALGELPARDGASAPLRVTRNDCTIVSRCNISHRRLKVRLARLCSRASSPGIGFAALAIRSHSTTRRPATSLPN